MLNILSNTIYFGICLSIIYISNTVFLENFNIILKKPFFTCVTGNNSAFSPESTAFCDASMRKIDFGFFYDAAIHNPNMLFTRHRIADHLHHFFKTRLFKIKHKLESDQFFLMTTNCDFLSFAKLGMLSDITHIKSNKYSKNSSSLLLDRRNY